MSSVLDSLCSTPPNTPPHPDGLPPQAFLGDLSQTHIALADGFRCPMAPTFFFFLKFLFFSTLTPRTFLPLQ